jgi:two-component system, OmpR family, response regulator
LKGLLSGFSVLIVEDDSELRALLRRALVEEGISVREAASGAQALERADQQVTSAVIIDIGLPDADGRDLCQALRARGIEAPVLFLTARDALADRLAGFSAGADDYITKPFALEELIARLRALLRRAGANETRPLGAVAHELIGADRAVPLTPTEFRLIGALASRPSEVRTRRELIRAAWPDGAIVHDNTLDVYIARLRRKLRSLPGAPTLRTVHGVGYRLG